VINLLLAFSWAAMTGDFSWVAGNRRSAGLFRAVAVAAADRASTRCISSGLALCLSGAVLHLGTAAVLDQSVAWDVIRPVPQNKPALIIEMPLRVKSDFEILLV
jgi:multicomponent Na+:H+ antiporter subunit E